MNQQSFADICPTCHSPNHAGRGLVRQGRDRHGKDRVVPCENHWHNVNVVDAKDLYAGKLREGDQKLPVPNDNRPIHEMVAEDVLARMSIGVKRYGTPLQTGNGRDYFQDVYEEVLDAAAYLKALMLEFDERLKQEYDRGYNDGENNPVH